MFDPVVPDDLVLLGTGNFRPGETYVGTILFDTDPTLDKEHRFTVTMKADDGREFSASVRMEF